MNQPLFAQPIVDKSLVNWDIQGARSKFIEKQNHLNEKKF